MIVEIAREQVKEKLQKNNIIVVVFEENRGKRGRAILQGFVKQSNEVITIYGNIYPKQFYTFRSFAEAQSLTKPILRRLFPSESRMTIRLILMSLERHNSFSSNM